MSSDPNTAITYGTGPRVIPADVIQTAEAKGKPLTPEEIDFAVKTLKAISYRIRHSDPEDVNGKLTACYYVTQGLGNAVQYLQFSKAEQTGEICFF